MMSCENPQFAIRNPQSGGQPTEVIVTRAADGKVTRAAGPGLVDLQLNGYAGMDFNGPVEQITKDEVVRACQVMRRRGVVAFLATLVTSAADRMVARVARIAALRREDPLLAAMIAGFHIEGPFINPNDGPRGAHPAEHVIAPKDRPGLLDELVQASGNTIRIFSLAPESEGALELIARAAGMGIVVALAHHAAGAGTIAAAVAAGAKMSTHLGNGSAAMLPRLDNYIQHQLADDRLLAGFIADGHHIPFPTLKNFLRAKQPQRSALVTDAMEAADRPPGQYKLGRRPVQLDPDGAVRLPGTPYLAGSALTLDKGVLNVARHCDVSFETAWLMASANPARFVGLPQPARVEVEVSEEEGLGPRTSGFRLRASDLP